MHKAKLFEKLAGNNVRCLACKHYCTISSERSGICGVRKNIKGELYLLVYGRSASTGIDPIEKKPLFHFLPNTKVFSFGTIGCNFGCSFCQNWDISQASKNLGSDSSKDKGFPGNFGKIEKFGYDLSPEEIVDYCIAHKIPSIAYTYNEPTIFFEYSLDTARLAHKHGIRNIYVTNGYASKEAIDTIVPYLDAANIDLKSYSDDFYKQICKASLQPVLDNIAYFVQKKVWVEVTTLIIPGKNDSDTELKAIAGFLASFSTDIPWHISRFTPQYKMQDIEETPDSTMSRAYEIGKQAGLNFVYTGNIFSKDTQSTYCPKCNELLIERDWGYTRSKALKKGICSNCGLNIKGVWI